MNKTKCAAWIFAAFLPIAAGAQTAAVEWGKWESWGDQGNGLYLNPVIPADFSDIDCIRVGDDYYAISSTFQFSPGMTVLHSRDLVNWEICGHAVADLTQIGPALGWRTMDRYGRGVWAGSIRHHGGRFYVFFGTPDEGYFMTSASSIEGPWEPLTTLLAEPGWDDCSALWDDDGKAYFVGTHFADGYKTYLFDMSADGKRIDRASARLVNEGSGREANKLIRVGQWYYLVFSEYKPGVGRYVMARRSRRAAGPYKEERQLALPCVEAMEPNQGGIVEGKDGRWYFFTHHGSGDGQRAGICHFSHGHSVLGVVRNGGVTRLEYRKNGRVEHGAPLEGTHLWLRTQWGLGGLSCYSYSTDGDQFFTVGAPYQMTWGNYRGDRVGIYCFNDSVEAGYVDVDYFHYR